MLAPPTRRRGFLLLLFTGLLAIDQLCKGLVPDPIVNEGFLFGAFSGESAFYRVFCTSIVLTLALLALGLAQSLLAPALPAWAAALVGIEAGIAGNGLDKIRLGYVRDFIVLPGAGFHFNFADVWLWTGSAAALWLVWSHPHQLWPARDLRRQWLAYPRAQSRLITTLVSVGTGLAGATGLVSLAYLQSAGIEYPETEVWVCFGLFLLLAALTLAVFGVYWSNRIYGPLRSLERYLRQKNPDSRPAVRLRMGDEDEAVRTILALLEKKWEGRR